MHIRLPCVAASLVVAVLVGSSRQAQGAREASEVPHEEKRLLVLEAPGNVLTKPARERLHAAIAEVAIGRGLTLASPASLPEKLLTCALPGCLPPVAAASGAIFVLRVDARFAKESFKLALELWNSDTGQLLGTERRDCPICDEQDLWGSAAFLARGLLERAMRESAPPVPVAVASAVAKPSPATPTPAPWLAQTPGPASATVPIARYAGWALSGLGLAALATGIYYWSADGDPAGGDYVRDTRKLGVPLTLSGGALLAAGAVLVGWSFWSGSAKLSAAPSGLRVAGSF